MWRKNRIVPAFQVPKVRQYIVSAIIPDKNKKKAPVETEAGNQN